MMEKPWQRHSTTVKCLKAVPVHKLHISRKELVAGKERGEKNTIALPKLLGRMKSTGHINEFFFSHWLW